MPVPTSWYHSLFSCLHLTPAAGSSKDPELPWILLRSGIGGSTWGGVKSETSIGGGLGDLAVEGLETQVDGAGDEVVDEDEDVDESSSTADGQVWSLTQFYSVDFSQSRISVIKCVFNKRTIKVCVSCS